MKYLVLLFLLCISCTACATEIGYVDFTVKFTSLQPTTIPAGDYCGFYIYLPEIMGVEFSSSDEFSEIATIIIDDISVPANLQDFNLNINITFPQDFVLDGTKELKIHYILKDNQNEELKNYSNPFVFADSSYVNKITNSNSSLASRWLGSNSITY